MNLEKQSTNLQMTLREVNKVGEGQKNVPKLRFKGYEDAWEQRKLHECADFRRGSFPQPYGNKEWFDGKGAMPFVQVADVTDDMKLVQNTKQQISKLAQPMSVLAERGSVLVTLQGSIGRVAISQYNAFIDRTILVFDNYKIDIDKSFCAYVVKGKFADEKRKAPGGTIKTITKEVLSSFDLVIPSFNEQEDIGEFLVNLDQLITLHQRKYDALKSMKKTLLSKMFPKNGEDVPEIRFKGYTDAWEQRKFSDIALRESTVQESSRDFPSVEYEDVIAEAGRLNKDVNQKEVAKKGIVFDGSQVLYGKLRPYLHNWLSPDFSGVAVGDWWVLKPIKVDKSFLYRLIQTQQFDDIANQSTGSKMPRADWNLVSNLEFAVPVSGDEQYKIGGYFSSLDTLIALHQRKLDELKNMKKTLLQQMFV